MATVQELEDSFKLNKMAFEKYSIEAKVSGVFLFNFEG